MPSYVAETYIARPGGEAIRAAEARARAAARELTRGGTPIRFVRSIFIPGDETCFYVFDAASAEAVEAACARSGLRFERVVPAVETPPSGQRKKGDDR